MGPSFNCCAKTCLEWSQQGVSLSSLSLLDLRPVSLSTRHPAQEQSKMRIRLVHKASSAGSDRGHSAASNSTKTERTSILATMGKSSQDPSATDLDSTDHSFALDQPPDGFDADVGPYDPDNDYFPDENMTDAEAAEEAARLRQEEIKEAKEFNKKNHGDLLPEPKQKRRRVAASRSGNQLSERVAIEPFLLAAGVKHAATPVSIRVDRRLLGSLGSIELNEEAFSSIRKPRYILNMEWDQLSWERSILDMPFLDDEELPFLREFDDHPEVSLEEVLEILPPTTFSTSEMTREHYHAVSNRGPGETLYSTLNPGQSMMNSHDHSSTYSLGAAPAGEAREPLYAYAARNQYPAYNQYPINDQYAANSQGGPVVMNNPSSTHAPNATPAGGGSNDTSKAQVSNSRSPRLKRTCKTCAQRKVKCNLISESDPMVCELCSKKGLMCEFEERKVFTRSGASTRVMDT
ncbi:uncharacterized protein M437DRAFT_66605 [Aureobasidium melanogenum CBS 110374]|uniref:Zn(2)-C6 fungal-type domain-containing protein n=1 Tax=Aureobasidium melanogenum (strain CBS 110374) TaxID=1043003 RepID=A0A074VSG8_AURM1|nr:uncharacterized protein M437DRAFT_66605 [Aureobasidium melanogenum CBS 110374]KEQ62169.1 hypothetical protein M437DRAFT_66605 [Aureobasidium melanogenum CBS 110374]